MTLEVVELEGQNLLGGTTLAAAGFFPRECARLMHALGVWGWQWGVGGGVVWSMCSYAGGAGVGQDMSTHCEGLTNILQCGTNFSFERIFSIHFVMKINILLKSCVMIKENE